MIIELMKLDPGYQKTGYQVDQYIKKLHIAMEQSKRLTSKIRSPKTIQDLKINPYCNVNLLIQNLERER